MPERVINDIIDNKDARIWYSPGWAQLGESNEDNHTTTSCSQGGGNFTFKFYGTSIKIYGTLGCAEQGHSNTTNPTYVLDGASLGPPKPFNPPPVIQYQQLFYSSPSLSHTEHTLVGICGDEVTPMYLDYFVVEIPIDLPDDHSSWTAKNSTTSAQASPTVTVVRSDSAIPDSSPPTPPTAIIVGSVAGGFAVVFVIGVFYLWLRRYRSPSEGPTPNRSGLPYLSFLSDAKSMTPSSTSTPIR